MTNFREYLQDGIYLSKFKLITVIEVMISVKESDVCETVQFIPFLPFVYFIF